MRWLAASLLLLGFGPLFWAPFVYDDPAFILRNPLVVGPWPGLRAYFLGSYFLGEYEPLNFLLHRALWHWGGDRVFLYRLSSLALHAGNAALAYRIYKRRLGAPVTAWWTALLVALYPGHVEALAVSVFKKHLLVAFFSLLSLNVQDSEASDSGRAAGAALCAALAVCCRESAALLPALSLALAWTRGRRDGVLIGAQCAVVALYAAVRLTLVPRHFQPLLEPTWTYHVLTCGKALLWDLGQLVLPTSISLEHSLGAVTTALDGALVLAGLAALAFGLRLLRDDKVAVFGAAWTLIALFPTLGLVPFANYSAVANRYLYLASFGFYLLWARLAMRFVRRSLEAAGWSRVAPPLIAAATALGAIRASAMFCEPVALWRHAAENAPSNPRAHGEFGRALQAAGELPEAEAEYKKALALDPDYLWAYTGLSSLYSQLGRLDEALASARERVARRGDGDAYFALAVALAGGGRLKEARPAFEKAVSLDDQPRYRLYLGSCYEGLGLKEKAREQWQLASKGGDPDVSARAGRSLAALY